MDLIISKRRLCFIYIAWMQLVNFLLYLFVGIMANILGLPVNIFSPELVLKMYFYLFLVFPFSIAPILTLIVGDWIYIRQVARQRKINTLFAILVIVALMFI